MTFNVWDEFQPLRHVVVGQGYPPDYFDYIQDPLVRDNLQKIFSEIEEDFQHLSHTLENLGVCVMRAPVMDKQQFQYSVSQDRYPMPPITPRDRQTVFGRKFVEMTPNQATRPMMDQIRAMDPENFIAATDPVMRSSNASSIFKLGRDIWFDESDWLLPAQSQWLIDNVLTDPRYRFHRMRTDGHSDCVFAVLKPGVILSTFHDAGMKYADEFPGWHIHSIDRPSIIDQFWNFRHEMHPGQTWWIPGRANLPEFRAYVDTYLREWTGCIHETVFDVNCLSVSPDRVIFACYNREVFAYCRQHGIEPILCELRHRWFFDGGVHCVTLDLEREGDMEDYF